MDLDPILGGGFDRDLDPFKKDFPKHCLFDMKLSTRYFTEAKDDSILKPCLSTTSGQFIDMKNVMRLAALGLDIIPLLPWK